MNVNKIGKIFQTQEHKIGRLNSKPESKNDLIMSEVNIVVHGEYGFSLDGVKWKEAIIQAILWHLYCLCS